MDPYSEGQYVVLGLDDSKPGTPVGRYFWSNHKGLNGLAAEIGEWMPSVRRLVDASDGDRENRIPITPEGIEYVLLRVAFLRRDKLFEDRKKSRQ